MKYIGYIFAAINVISVIAMLICAYSSYLHPMSFPEWSYLGMGFPIPLFINIAFLLFWLFCKIKYMLISTIGMVLCINTIRTYFPINPFQGEPTGRTIKVLSYNTMNFNRQKDNEKWEENNIMNYIVNCDADILCLQECYLIKQQNGIEYLRKTYPYIEFSDSVGPKNGEILIGSKYPIISNGTINIHSENNVCCFHNILLGEDTLTLINSHLESYKLSPEDKEKYKDIFYSIPEHEDSYIVEENIDLLRNKLATATSIRSLQADTVAAFISNCKSKYIICCGDFNDCSISYVHRKLTEKLNDAYTQSGNGAGLSYHRSGMHFRIDNILISSNFKPFGAKVDDSIKDSDHYPIFCTLEY